MVSLAFIDPWSSGAFFDERETAQQTTHDAAYVVDLDIVAEINTILLNAAQGLSAVASPAVFGWSMILREIRNTSVSRREARELRQSQRAIDGFQSDQNADDDSEHVGLSNRPTRRRNSGSSELSLEGGLHDRIMEAVMDTPLEDDPVEYLARSAVDGSKVFDVLTMLASTSYHLTATTKAKSRLIILDCLRCATTILTYIPELATAILAAVVGDQQFWELEEQTSSDPYDDPIAAFCLDDMLREYLLGMATSRYPYEAPPFLQIARAIANCQSLEAKDHGPILLDWLSALHSFTYELPPDFRDYETTQEEENNNTVLLTHPVPLFEPRGNKLLAFRAAGGDAAALGSEDFVIPAGTSGRIIADGEPKVAIWFHQLSGLRYLGKLLETALTAGEFVDATTQKMVDRDSLVEIVGIVATLILNSNKLERKQSGMLDSQGPTHRILEEASDGLSRNRDVVSVIFSIFEEELQRQADGSDESLDLLVNCVQFIYALVPILPGRVWPLLGRSGLLEINGRGGKLSTIFTGIEMTSCRYDFLISCAYLLEVLVEDAVINAVTRKSRSKTMVRFGTSEDLGTGVPNHILANVIFSFTRAVSEAFVSSCNWKYLEQQQRLTLSHLTAGILDKILHYTYSIDDMCSPANKLTGTLAQAAEYIVQSFLSTSSGHLRFQPFLRALLDGLSTPDASSQEYPNGLWLKHVKTVTGFATTLVQVSVLTERRCTQLEVQLFRASPLIVRLYAAHETYQEQVIRILNALVISAASGEEEPPSLLGHLGSQSSKHFLHMLSDLGRPLDNDGHAVAIWKLLSSVVSNRQQWFSIYLLTGKTPRASLEQKSGSGKNATGLSKPLLKVALDALLCIEKMSLPRAVVMLEFVSLSQNFWPWASGDLQRGSEFIKAISEYVSKIEPVPASAKVDRCIEGSYQAKMAAIIAEILAMYLYHQRQLGDKKAAEEALTHISYYARCAVSVPSYNTSLHGNLKRNFEAKFTGCTLQNFKRTRLESRQFGRSFFYNGNLADKMLSSDQAWAGRKNDGLSEELANANVNLSLVEAQVVCVRRKTSVKKTANVFQDVLQGWKMLATELSCTIGPNKGLHRVVAKIIIDCLISNNRTQLPENVFTQLNQTRADLALILTQRLIESKTDIQESLGILSKVWDTISSLDTTFEMALASGDPRDATYYRTLLKILFLSLRPHAGVQETLPDPKGLSKEASQKAGEKLAQSSARTQLVLEIINKVVFHGFRDLARCIHELPEVSNPADIALLTGILQASLNIPGMEFSHNQILISMTTSDVARVATTLYSWSDKLAISGDPIYGELSMLFLLELSSIPAIAEQLALEGVLGHIASASITSYLRQPGISPFADGAGPQRCYAIWTRGILPLLLNLLDAVGSSIASEVAIFLKQFPQLLTSSVAAIDTPGSTVREERKTKHLCYGLVQEISCLTLIAFVLSRFRDSMAGVVDVPEVAGWDVVEVRESVEWWLGSRAVLRERIIPLGPKEQSWAKSKPINDKIGARSRLEEMIVEELIGIRDVLNGGEA